MKPGRELDAIVAEKVFGCKVLRANDEGLSQSEYERRRRWEKERCGCAGSLHNDSDDEGCYEWLKEYSTDIAAAFEVVEKMRDPGSHRDCFSLYSPTDTVKDWFACFDRKWHGHSLESVGPDAYLELESGESAPHAICLAALKAVGADLASLG